MRDLVFVAFLAALFATGFRRPFLFLMAYAYIDIVSPQRLTYILLNSVPISLIAVGLSVLGWLAMDDKRDVRVAPRQLLIVLLLGYCFYTTMHADFPMEAKDKWEWVWKALAFAAFLPLTLRTKLRIESLLLFMILSAASIIIVGGIKTVGSGGGYGELNLMVTNNSGLYEGSTISMVAIAIIPLILWFTKFGTIFVPDWRVKTFCYCLVFACLLIPVGTSTRTGLLCIVLLAILMIRDFKRPMVYLAGLATMGVCAIPFLPSAFTERMETIQTYQGDASASTRIAVWQWTMEYVKTHPMGGGFETYRQNQIRYEKVALETDSDGHQAIKRSWEIDKARAYHSSYFEMLGEQGYPGLIIWLLINLIGLFRMEVLRQRYKKAEDGQEWIAPLAAGLQNAHIIYLLGSFFIAIAFQPFVYMLIGAQIGLDTYCARKREETSLAALAQTETGNRVKHELKALTSVRGIAAWMVVLFHIRDAMPGLPHAALAVLAHGYLAVDFFFLLSGFVIWNSYADRIRAGRAAALPDFFKRRIARIWPLHLFMLGIGLALALLLDAAGRDTHDFPLAELPLHVLLLQNWGFTQHLSWNDPAWSISCEFGAYLLFPLLALAIDWKRVPTLAILAAIAALLMLLHTVFAMRGATQLGQALTQLGLIRCILEFACGTAIGALWLRWRDIWQTPAIVSGALALAFAAAGILVMLPETFAAPAAFAAGLLALALTRGSPLEAAPLHYLGEISYATYLGHYLLWFAFKLAIVDNPHAVPLPLIALYLGLVAISSVALYHFVERPAQRWINGLRLPPRSHREPA